MTDEPKKPRQPSLSGEEAFTGERASLSRLATEWPDEDSSTRTTESVIAAAPPSVPPQQRTRALLTVVTGPGTGGVHTLRDRETVIGRGKEAHLRFDDSGASRTHARIIRTDHGTWILEDLRSTNGTFVDGQRVERTELHSGDRVHIGPNVVISFAILDAQAERITAQLYESSVRDPLTRAHNRRYLVERLTSEIAYAKRHRAPLGLILFDLDHFKRVNDTYGHLAGDDVLRDVSALVQRLIRVEDVFARFGGEEFVLLVRGIEHGNLNRFAERLRVAVERLEVATEQTTVRVTVSVGTASLGELPEDDRDADGLLRRADERLYRAKTDGRNRVVGR